jgi:hypothetical protein
MGEQAHGAYCVSMIVTVVVSYPESTSMARPKPSSVVFFHWWRPCASASRVAVWVLGL